MNGGHVDQLHTFADRADASDRAQSARISLPSDIDRVVEISKIPFLDDVVVKFGISNIKEHYHVPLLVSPWS